MKHETDIRLVDPHAKCNGGHNDLHVIFGEQFLILAPFRFRQARMIRTDGKPLIFQYRGKLIHLSAGGAVNNAGLIRKLIDNMDGLLKGLVFRKYPQKKVFTVKTGNKFI